MNNPDFEDLIEQFAEVYYDLGCTYEEELDFKTARDIYEQVFALDPEYKDIRTRLGNIDLWVLSQRKFEILKRLRLGEKIRPFLRGIVTDFRISTFRTELYLILIGIIPLLILSLPELLLKPLILSWGPPLVVFTLSYAMIVLASSLFIIGGIEFVTYLQNSRTGWIGKIVKSITWSLRFYKEQCEYCRQMSQPYIYYSLHAIVIVIVIIFVVLTLLFCYYLVPTLFVKWSDFTLIECLWYLYLLTSVWWILRSLKRVYHIRHLSVPHSGTLPRILFAGGLGTAVFSPIVYHWYEADTLTNEIILRSTFWLSLISGVYWSEIQKYSPLP